MLAGLADFLYPGQDGLYVGIDFVPVVVNAGYGVWSYQAFVGADVLVVDVAGEGRREPEAPVNPEGAGGELV